MTDRPTEAAGLSPWDSLGFHCNLTFRAFARALDEALEGAGVSSAQCVALAHLVAAGPLVQSQLAERLMVAPPTAARLVDRMERDGWIVRRPDPSDRRIKQVELTPAARTVWGEVSQTVRGILDRAYRGIQGEELEAAKRVLARVRDNLDR